MDYNNGNCVSACSDNLPILLKFFSKVFVERSEEWGGVTGEYAECRWGFSFNMGIV